MSGLVLVPGVEVQFLLPRRFSAAQDGPGQRLMHAGVACGTEGNQVLLAIVAGLAAKFLMMNLKI